MIFEQDEEKNLANIEKHGISFNKALKVFKNKYFYDYGFWHSENEDRFLAIGLVFGIFYTVSYTYRINKDGKENVRIISARKSTENEIEDYIRRF